MSTQDNTGLGFHLEVMQLLKRVAHEEGLQEYHIEKDLNSVKGEGYLGTITAIELRGVSASGPKTLSLVIKSALKGDAVRAEMPVADAYQREIHVYHTVIPALQRFLIDKALPPFPSFAKCYAATTLTNAETLILENLKTGGFELCERRRPMDEEHVARVLEEYGRFHGISLALKDQDPGKFEELTRSMDDMMCKFFGKHHYLMLMLKECHKAAGLFHLSEHADVQKEFMDFIERAPEFIKSLSEPARDYAVISHGDCWTNNLMFKYDDATNPGTPTKMCFIDLQMSRLGPPVLDVSYFFYACSPKAVLDNHRHYLDLYYASLAERVKQLGSNPDEAYPYQVFRQQWKKFAKYGLILFIMVIKTMLTEEDEVVDLAKFAESGKAFSDALDYKLSNSAEHEQRVKDIVSHFYKNNLF